MNQKNLSFALLLCGSALLSAPVLYALIRSSLQNESMSHILLIPFLSAVLFRFEWSKIQAGARFGFLGGAVLLAAGGSAALLVRLHPQSFSPMNYLSASVASLVLFWIGAFLFSYGPAAFRAAVFPLFFLFLAAPIPEQLLHWMIVGLQSASADLTYFLMHLFHVPVFRNGFVFILPDVVIQVAEECSGIRSTLSLFITALLTAHLFLRSRWAAVALCAAVIPLAIFKNAVRITTLTLLSVHVDPGFLSGNLHHRGGVVFFLFTLGILYLFLLGLQAIERRSARSEQSVQSSLP